MWNALRPIVLPALLLGLVPEARKNTYLGLLTFAGLVIAMIIQAISGAVSDGWSSCLGRRRPLIALGTGFACLFLVALTWAGGLAWLFVGYLGRQFSSNVAQGPLQGLLRDRVPIRQMGAASSFIFDGFCVVASALFLTRVQVGR
jgi:MFS family permease